MSLSPIESAVYSDLSAEKSYGIKSDPRRALCTNFEREWGDTLTEVREYWIDKKKTRISEKKKVIKELRASILNAPEGMHANTRAAMKRRVNRECDAHQRIINSDTRLLQQYEEIVSLEFKKSFNQKWKKNFLQIILMHCVSTMIFFLLALKTYINIAIVGTR